MRNLTTKNLTLAAISIALVFVSTYAIAIPVGSGFINPSEVIIMVVAIIFGPYIGAVSGLGAGIADLALGYGAWMPFTIFTKVITGFLVGKMKNKYIAMGISTLIMIGTYSLAELVLYGIVEPTQLIGNFIQCLVAIVIAVPIAYRLKIRKGAKYTKY